jgi:hypothetical protein
MVLCSRLGDAASTGLPASGAEVLGADALGVGTGASTTPASSGERGDSRGGGPP